MEKQINKEFISPKILVGLLGVIFLAAFILNFSALSHLAAEVLGVQPLWFSNGNLSGSLLPYLLPILIDFFLLLSVFVVLRNESVGEPAKLAWGIIAATTAGAILLNFLHYGAIPDVIEVWEYSLKAIQLKIIIVALIVPTAILLSSELVRGLLGSVNRRYGVIKTINNLIDMSQELETRVAELETETSQIETKNQERESQLKAGYTLRKNEQDSQLESLQLQVEEAENQLNTLKLAQKEAKKPVFCENSFQLGQVDGLKFAGVTNVRAGEFLDLSAATIATRIKSLNGGSLHHSGKEL